ncbi:MAG: hypothetical protein FWG99_09645 [Treponema sp.]|nr:hypothetical protein [Treponema sp.]
MKKKIYLFLTIIVLYSGCHKSKSDSIQDYADKSKSTPYTSATDNMAGTQILQEERTVQEIIRSHSTIEPYLRFSGRTSYMFQIEGNFTGSGNKEIIAFYQQGGSLSINAAFCFVLDPNENKIESIYYLDGYGTLRLSEEDEAESGLIEAEALGRPIMWDNRIIGRVGDFNGDGKEELYLYRLSGMNVTVKTSTSTAE